MPKGIYIRTKPSWNKGGKHPYFGKSSPALGIHWEHTEEAKRKIGIASKGNKYRLGKKLSEEHKRRIILANTGLKHWRWIEDRTKLAKKQERNDVAYQEWRRNVWARDEFKCRIENLDCSGRIVAHHILAWRDYPELRYQVNNGITLCLAHHPRKWTEEKRLVPSFQELIGVPMLMI